MTLPTNLVELKAAHQAAGERYAAAITELEASYIELASIDRALQNANVNPGGDYDHPTFRGDLDLLPVEMMHPRFGAYTSDFRGRVNAAAMPIINAISN